MLARLKAKQQELGLNDSAFADRLGVPRSTWLLTKRGERPIRNKIIRATMRSFPELIPDALSYLVGDDYLQPVA